MTPAITLYDALTTVSIPSDKAKAVVHAWEAEVENLASKADLKQVEAHFKSDLKQVETHLTQSITALGTELRSSIKELQSALREQGVELRAELKEQRAEFRAELKEQRAEQRSSTRVLQWSIGVTFLCVAAPFIKNAFEVLATSY
ncbi:hypothetical protein [Pseudomonas batumici]|uniref:DUF1640 domain-containing protein n=1 Tax=Pseudomonas batumici TaxID=226910 RepID=A0A0C2ICW8_9PSED|nr:hypothetical protein [Pseudomonas batumici]KIH82837.1 hypothetical protein UCMB321_3292 [Pseudomonas batumici]